MIPAGVQVYIALEPVDMRYGFERLAGIVRDRIGYKARSGALFVFFGRLTATATRSCEIPEGKIILFPLANSICLPCHEDEGCSTTKTEAELAACSKFEKATFQGAWVDGRIIVPLDVHRFATTPFSFKGPATGGIFGACTGPITTNTCGVPVGDRYGVADGWWVALKPTLQGQTHPPISIEHHVGRNGVPAERRLHADDQVAVPRRLDDSRLRARSYGRYCHCVH